jgi:hypothetical protein
LRQERHPRSSGLASDDSVQRSQHYGPIIEADDSAKVIRVVRPSWTTELDELRVIAPKQLPRHFDRAGRSVASR